MNRKHFFNDLYTKNIVYTPNSIIASPIWKLQVTRNDKKETFLTNIVTAILLLIQK